MHVGDDGVKVTFDGYVDEWTLPFERIRAAPERDEDTFESFTAEITRVGLGFYIADGDIYIGLEGFAGGVPPRWLEVGTRVTGQKSWMPRGQNNWRAHDVRLSSTFEQRVTTAMTTPGSVRVDLFIKNIMIGAIIGTSGKNIRQLQASTGCSIFTARSVQEETDSRPEHLPEDHQVVSLVGRPSEVRSIRALLPDEPTLLSPYSLFNRLTARLD